MIRFGKIVNADVKNGVYRVDIDADELVTDWLPRLEWKTKGTNYSTPLVEGEHVALLMDENMEAGVILGAIYDQKNIPSGIISNDNITGVRFEDGTLVTYDKGAGLYTINSVANVRIVAAQKVQIQCTDLEVTGNIEATGDIKTVLGTVIAGTVNLKTHTHAETGTNTGPPL